MEEGQVTLEGETRRLPQPFFVIATQNPTQHIGTYPLPESQLDRFLMRIHLGYPDAQSERELLKNNGGRAQANRLQACADSQSLLKLQAEVDKVHVSEVVLDYIQALLQFSRVHAQAVAGLSPRAGLALKRCAQAWAMMDGRDFVIPEDVQAVFRSVAAHRLQKSSGAEGAQDLASHILSAVAVA
jgi:MoxR-like ATPase